MIIRWVSEDGKRKWIYPIEKDIYTKGKIIKQISKKAKVIGITKVNIPSPLHPITPYYVVLLEDEYGNKMPKKSMKGYDIGDIYEIVPAKTDSAVIVSKLKYDIIEYLNESIKLLHDYKLDESDKIIIKPSIIEPAYGYQAVTTNPKVLDALISILKGRGIEDIVVGEQAMIGNDLIAAAKKSGIIDVCRKHDVKFIDLKDSGFQEMEIDNNKYNISNEILNRKIINIPVMKTNSQIGISGAIENLIRVTDEDTQKKMFKGDIEKTLPDLIKAIPSFLSIGDASIGLMAQGPTIIGEPAFLNMIFVGKDPVALDTIFANMGMLQIPGYITEAARINVGISNTSKIEVIGEELEAIRFHLTPAIKTASAHQKISIIDGKADPLTFNTALKITSKLVGVLGEEINLAIGKFISDDMLAGRSRIVALGSDAIGRLKELNVTPVAEIPENMDNVEKFMAIKSILENPDKTKVSIGDKFKSKMANLGSKIKGGY